MLNMKKTILLVYSGECHKLPPFLAILDSLHERYRLLVISYEKESNSSILKARYPDVCFLSKLSRPAQESFFDKVIRHLYYPIHFHNEAKHLISNTSFDLLWIIHEKTLLEFGSFLKSYDYIMSFYELIDNDNNYVKRMTPFVRRAREIITAEYNRSCIMRVWYKLNYTPDVIPNKPLYHPQEKNIHCQYSELFWGKKIILYQGHIQRVRNVDSFCEAINEMNGYTLVLMGDGDAEYVNYLKNKYPNVIYIDYIAPPHHLDVTSHAFIGVVKYDYTYLNHLYCAPNKIWEYSGFGIPMLGNKLPGLQNTFEKYGAGICIDTDKKEEIKKAITDIDSKYDYYSENAKLFYGSFDVKQALLSIVERNI